MASLTRIRPNTGWEPLNLGELWKFRDLLYALALRDVKLRYRQTVLGVAWVLLQPLIGAGVFSFVFGRVAKLDSGGVPYFVFSYAGLLGWNLFSTTLGKVSTCLVQNAGMISKVSFPRLVLPLSTVFGTCMDLVVALGLLTIFLPIFGIWPGAAFLILPVWVALILMFSMGCGLMAAALMVSYRDVQYIVPVMMQFLLYASPVAYSVSAVPEKLRPFYQLNPLAGLLEGLRWSFFGESLDWSSAGFAASMAVAMFFAGAYSFKRMERQFADVI